MDKTKIKSSCYLVILLVVFVAAWQLMADKGMINPLFFSSPEKVWADIVEMFSTGYIFPHIQITLYASFVGLFYGILLGTIVALIVGENQVLARVIEPILVGINGLPLLSLGPLFVVWFGIGIKSKIVMATISVFFIVFFNIYAGIKDVDVQLIQTLKLMRANKIQIIRKVILPSCIPWMMASLKAGVGGAVLGAIVGEYLGASAGLGWVIQMAGGYYNITRVIACVIILMVIMFILNAIVSWIDRKVLVWRPSIDK